MPNDYEVGPFEISYTPIVGAQPVTDYRVQYGLGEEIDMGYRAVDRGDDDGDNFLVVAGLWLGLVALVVSVWKE